MPAHRLLFLDFETYYDQEYSLSNMPTPNYILDPRWETIMCAAKEDNGPSRIVDGPDFPAFIAGFDPAHTTTVAFNALFDNSILAWRYGFVPALMLDAMGMARALRGHLLPSSSLAAVSRLMGLGEKGGTLIKVKGMRRNDIKQAGLWPEFSAYAVQDVDLLYGIFMGLIPEFPRAERRLMDLVLRCAVQPKFVADVEMLQEHLVDVREQKAELLSKCGVGVDELMSTDKFKDALERLGVPIEYKVTMAAAAKAEATGEPAKTVPAFAKTDEFMSKLLVHYDPAVQALAAARLGHKSTIEETRTEKLISIATLPWEQVGCEGTLPVPLAYGRAHTQRLAGEWGMNMQNLPTERGSKGKSRLRKGLIVPPDHEVVVADLGQIEARLVAWICGAKNLLKQFRDKLDPYAILASEIFGFPVNRKVHKIEGFIGKTGILGCGYGAGAPKFFNMVLTQSRINDINLGGMWTPELALKSVGAYRSTYFAIPQGWNRLGNILETSWLGHARSVFGPVTIEHGKVLGPNGLTLKPGEATSLKVRLSSELLV